MNLYAWSVVADRPKHCRQMMRYGMLSRDIVSYYQPESTHSFVTPASTKAYTFPRGVFFIFIQQKKFDESRFIKLFANVYQLALQRILPTISQHYLFLNQRDFSSRSQAKAELNFIWRLQSF